MQCRSLLRGTAVLFAGGLFLGLGAVASAEEYKVDPVHSTVLFRVKHFGAGYIYGRFNQVHGTFNIDESNPANSSFDLEVKTASLDTGQPKRDQHLKSPDFFNVKESPTITFKSTQVKQLDNNTYEVTGDLTLLGVTKPLTVKVERVGTGKDPRGTTRSGFESTFTIERAEFGMKFMVGPVSNDVRVTVAVEGVR